MPKIKLYNAVILNDVKQENIHQTVSCFLAKCQLKTTTEQSDTRLKQLLWHINAKMNLTKLT